MSLFNNNANQDVVTTDRNTEVPFFPSSSYSIVEADKFNPGSPVLSKLTLPAFFWIQAFFDAGQLTVLPQLAVWSGKLDDSGNRIVSLVQFAFSGEMKPFKGKAIFTTGTDRRGNTINSTVIGSTVTTDLTQVIVYGGIY